MKGDLEAKGYSSEFKMEGEEGIGISYLVDKFHCLKTYTFNLYDEIMDNCRKVHVSDEVIQEVSDIEEMSILIRRTFS